MICFPYPKRITSAAMAMVRLAYVAALAHALWRIYQEEKQWANQHGPSWGTPYWKRSLASKSPSEKTA